jgi:hypothetical protein
VPPGCRAAALLHPQAGDRHRPGGWPGSATDRCNSGYDLLGTVHRVAGHARIATKIIVKLTQIPQLIACLLAGFPSTSAGGNAMSAIIETAPSRRRSR